MESLKPHHFFHHFRGTPRVGVVLGTEAALARILVYQPWELTKGRPAIRGTSSGWYGEVEQGLPFLLDRLEGHPSFYRRRLIEIEGGDGECFEAWAYFVVRAEARLATLPPLRTYGRV